MNNKICKRRLDKESREEKYLSNAREYIRYIILEEHYRIAEIVHEANRKLNKYEDHIPIELYDSLQSFIDEILAELDA